MIGTKELEAKKDGTADDLGRMAQALRSAGHGGGEGSGVGRIADYTADGLERLSANLRGKDLDTLLRDAESFARRQPIAFFGAALAVGFLATRFMKASRPDAPQASGPASPGGPVTQPAGGPVISSGD